MIITKATISRSFARILVSSAIFFCLWTAIEHTAPSFFYNVGSKDVLQYRSAATLFLRGLNPYNKTLISDVQQKTWHGEPIAIPIIFYTPPMLLSLVFPMGLLSFKLSVYLWLSIMFALSLESCVLCYNLFESIRKEIRTVKLGLAFFFLTFFPFYTSFYFGQLSPLLLFGLVLSLVCFDRGNRGVVNNFLGGLCLSVTSLKPHLLYLLYIYIFILSIREKKWKTLAGMMSGIIILMVFPVLYNPKIITYFFHSAKSPPVYWKSPTLGSFFQGMFQKHSVILRFIPTIIAGSLMTLFIFLSKRNLSKTTAIYYLLPLSLLTTPYCWVYDQMLIAPAIFFIFSRFQKTIYRWNSRQFLVGILLILANIIGMLIPGKSGQHVYVWYPIVILGAVAGVTWQYRNAGKP